MPFAAIALLTSQLVFEAPEIRAAGECPSAARVAALLTPLLPVAGHDGLSAPDVAELTGNPSELRVRLHDPAGGVVHDRVLAAGASCSERAAAAAAIIAAWEADLHEDVAFPTQLEPAPDPALAPPPAVHAEPAPKPLPASVADARPQSARDAAVPRVVVTVGAALLAAAPGGGGPAPAGLLELTLSRGGPFHGRLSALATGTHTAPLAPGQVTWRRVGFGLGAVADLTRRRIWASGRADAIMAAVLSEGTGFSVNQSATSWQAGVDLAGRVGVAVTSRLSFWADLAVVAFPGAQRFSVENAGTVPPIPGTEVQAGLGLSFLLSR